MLAAVNIVEKSVVKEFLCVANAGCTIASEASTSDTEAVEMTVALIAALTGV
jgi:hypothetical protein